MNTYARMIDGRIAQIISAKLDDDGVEIPLLLRFDAEIVDQIVDYTPAKRPEPPQPTHDELVDEAKAQIRAERQPILSVLDGLQASYITLGDMPTAILIETAKQALRDITKVDLSACETLADMKVVVMTRYAQIASASPALKSAFAQAVQ